MTDVLTKKTFRAAHATNLEGSVMSDSWFHTRTIVIEFNGHAMHDIKSKGHAVHDS